VIKGGGVDMFVVYQQIQKSLFQQSSMTDLCSRAIGTLVFMQVVSLMGAELP